jgi:hypothetical protein
MRLHLLAVAITQAITPAAAETPAEGQERLMWEYALRTDRTLRIPGGYHDYLRFHPNGKHAAEARRRLREQVYRGRPDIMPLPHAPGWTGIAGEDWKLRPAEHLMWKRTTRADTAQAYEEYLSLYGADGNYVAEALKRWVDLTHRGDPKALQLPPKHRWRAT